MPKTEDEIERALDNIIGSWAIEGRKLSDEQIATCRGILNGEIDSKEHVKKLLKKYSVNKDNDDSREAG